MTTLTPIAGPSPKRLAASIERRLAALSRRKAEVEQEIETLQRTLTTLRAEPEKAPRVPRKTRVRSSEKQAGPGNVARVAAALASLGGRATQAAITERAGLHSGTVTYALRALVEAQQAKPTGTKVGRSPEYQVTRGTIRMRPGSVTE